MATEFVCYRCKRERPPDALEKVSDAKGVSRQYRCLDEAECDEYQQRQKYPEQFDDDART